MSDPVNQYMSLYTITLRNAVEYYPLGVSQYATDLKNESIVKCNNLQGYYTGSLYNALQYINDNTTTPASLWGIEQVGLLKQLFSMFSFSYTGPGSTLNPGVFNRNPDPVRQYLTLYRLTYRQAIEYTNASDKTSGYGLSLQQECSDGTVVVNGSTCYGKCWMLQDVSGNVTGSLFNALAYINDPQSISLWAQDQQTNIKNLFAMFMFVYGDITIDTHGFDFGDIGHSFQTVLSQGPFGKLINIRIINGIAYENIVQITITSTNGFSNPIVSISDEINFYVSVYGSSISIGIAGSSQYLLNGDVIYSITSDTDIGNVTDVYIYNQT